MTTKLLYLVALLYRACLFNAQPPPPAGQLTQTVVPSPAPLHIATYALVRRILNQPAIPLHDMYQLPKKLPTAYPLLTSTDFIALKNTPLQEGDAIIVKQPPLLNTPGSHLFFDVATPTHQSIGYPNNPNLFSYSLIAGKITLYSWHQYYGEIPTVETYDIMVTKRK